MMNENHIVNAFYQKYDEDKRLSDRQGYVEYITTMKYIYKYLNHFVLLETSTIL